MNIDARDRQILYELDVDCRQPISRIASKLGMSKQRVSYRIARLEEEGIIMGYRTLIDATRLGFIQFRGYVTLRRADEAKVGEIMRFLKGRKEVWGLARITGSADIIFVMGARKTRDYNAFWGEVENKFKPWIARTRVSVYSPIYHFSKAYLTGKKDETKPRIIGGDPVETDELDMKILKIISNEARTKAVEIARAAGSDPETVAYRIKRLAATGVIQGYRASIDIEKLGYEYYKADFSLTRTVKREQIREYCRQEPNMYQVNEPIGGGDLEVEFHVRSLHELLGKIQELRRAFPETIECYDYIRILNEEKMTYYPE
ncbi:MAG: Lrp/AsnC family transcriptional regulator [Candidatus Micrarchaeota archaeon]